MLLIPPANHFIIISFMQDTGPYLQEWEGYVDWRNRPALKGRHGGVLAVSFVLGS